MSYVDGFVLVVPKKKLAAYTKLARLAGKVWREHGALDYRECVADDLKVKFGLPFTKLVKSRRARRSCSPTSSTSRDRIATRSMPR